MTERPRNIGNDILDCVETATAKWARQKKSEERHPGNIAIPLLAYDPRADAPLRRKPRGR